MSDFMLPEDDDLAIERQRVFNQRRAFVAGLRELASFVDAHPDLPLPIASNHNAFVNTKAELAALARSGVRWEKSANGNYFYLRVTFTGGHSFDVNVQREQVCRKVVTGTHLEPAVPAHEVEDFHWVCDEPLLAEGRS